MIRIPVSAWPASSSSSIGALGPEPLGDELNVVLADQHLGLEVVDGGQHGAHRRRRVVPVAPDPPGDLGVGLGPLQRGVPADQLDLVEQHHPPGVPGRLHRDGRRSGTAGADRSRSLIAASR